jgi:DNA-directed RNA polymerase specialized sigma24 family protein
MTKNLSNDHRPDILMQKLAQIGQNRQEGDKAARMLHQLYLSFVVDLCKKLCAKKCPMDTDLWEDISAKVLGKLFTKADTFKMKQKPDGKQPTYKEADAGIRNWLYRIAQNEVMDYLREKRSRETLHKNDYGYDELVENQLLSSDTIDYIESSMQDQMVQLVRDSQRRMISKDEEGFELEDELEDEVEDVFMCNSSDVVLNEFVTEEEDEHSESYDAYLKKYERHLNEAEKLLNAMSEKKREVFWAYVMEEDEKGHLPQEIRDELCRKHGLHKDYLAKVKKKVGEYLREKLYDKYDLLLFDE